MNRASRRRTKFEHTSLGAFFSKNNKDSPLSQGIIGICIRTGTICSRSPAKAKPKSMADADNKTPNASEGIHTPPDAENMDADADVDMTGQTIAEERPAEPSAEKITETALLPWNTHYELMPSHFYATGDLKKEFRGRFQPQINEERQHLLPARRSESCGSSTEPPDEKIIEAALLPRSLRYKTMPTHFNERGNLLKRYASLRPRTNQERERTHHLAQGSRTPASSTLINQRKAGDPGGNEFPEYADCTSCRMRTLKCVVTKDALDHGGSAVACEYCIKKGWQCSYLKDLESVGDFEDRRVDRVFTDRIHSKFGRKEFQDEEIQQSLAQMRYLLDQYKRAIEKKQEKQDPLCPLSIFPLLGLPIVQQETPNVPAPNGFSSIHALRRMLGVPVGVAVKETWEQWSLQIVDDVNLICAVLN
jgi:hypothetical protein